MQAKSVNWRGIAALNAVSTFAQLGQFGVGFIAMPIWLVSRGLNALDLGLYGAASWVGMLIGLMLVPKLLGHISSKTVVILGMVISIVGFLLIPFVVWPVWVLPGFMIGLGTGFRWIANETWLYRISPLSIVGQVVGFHEALISLSVIVGPLLVVWFTTQDNSIIYIGAFLCAISLFPLTFVASEPINKPSVARQNKENQAVLLDMSLGHHNERKSVDGHPFNRLNKLTQLGIALAIVGGLVDGAMTSIFPVFASERGLNEPEVASLLAYIGLGALLLQYPFGWLSHKVGLIKASLLAAVVSMFVSFAIAFFTLSYLELGALSFLFGGFTATFLTLGIVAAALESKPSLMARNMSKISIAFTASSIIGALITGVVANQLGGDALFWFVSLISALLTLIFVVNRHAL